MRALQNHEIRNALWIAWIESQPGTEHAHEEGGFVLQESSGTLKVERWQCGTHNEIEVPDHNGGRRNHEIIVASFHTHPNVGPGYQQEPSLTDIRAVGSDPDFAHAEYEGELVISELKVYLVPRSGQVECLGDTQKLLNHPQGGSDGNGNA